MRYKNIFLIVFVLGMLPKLSNAQFWKRTLTSLYQQQVEPLDSLDAPVYELSLPVTLPIVFHVIYPRSDQAISLSDVEWQVEQLNRHFSLQELYEKQQLYGESEFDEYAADTEIEFCIKSVHFIPSDSLLYAQFNTIKQNSTLGADIFLPKEHINVWVGQLGGNSGFAQLPGGIWETDGIVIDMDFFGPQEEGPYNEGKTLTHLLGNYLGLKDLWGTNNCEDDGVEDTPIHNAPNYNQVEIGENHISLCPGFEREMFMNYMDNNVDSMLYFFTQGQKERMHQFLQLERNGLLGGGCEQAQQRSPVNSSSIPRRDDALSAYPNPTNGQLNIRYHDESGKPAVLRIYSLVGKLLHQQHVGSDFNEEFQIGSWQSGVYLITVSGSENHSLKIVKQ